MGSGQPPEPPVDPLLVRHGESEHPLGLNAGVDRTRVEELLLPIWPVSRHVDLQQRSPESSCLIGMYVDGHGTSVNCDRELLAGNMGSADVRPAPDVPKAHRVGARA